ncbi:MAG: alpha/beta hydrolase fold domain-containing protein [Chloroflexi bacterium]|nr:alpha/beta hydrolase fold domain-containing protein [Chloroflexota bacterium]
MLLERERELAAVQQLIEHGGGVLLVEGRAGVGKTSLLDAAARNAREADWNVVQARGPQLETDFAFGVVRQLFERRLAGMRVDEREMLLGSSAQAVYPGLFWQQLSAPAADQGSATVYFKDPVDMRDQYASILNASDLRGLPPMLVQAAELDRLVGDGKELVRRLQEADVPVTYKLYQDVPHMFYQWWHAADKAREAVDDTCAALKEAFAWSASATELSAAR